MAHQVNGVVAQSKGAPVKLAPILVPDPGPGEALIRVKACGVCHTELDEIEGRTSPPRLPVIPGHQVVGRVEALGADGEHVEEEVSDLGGRREREHSPDGTDADFEVLAR